MTMDRGQLAEVVKRINRVQAQLGGVVDARHIDEAALEKRLLSLA